MQVSVESLSDLKRAMKVVVPQEVVDEAIGGRLAELSRSVRLDGFRPGKVPMRVIKSQFGARVKGEVQANLVEKSFYEALNQEQLKPAGAPQITQEENPEAGLAYSAVFEIYPEVALSDLSALSIEKLSAEVADSDIDEMVERLRSQRVKWNEVDRASEKDDRVIIDFEGKVNDEPISEERIKNFPVTLGSGSMIPGFEDQLTGVTAGQTLEIEATFPEDYSEAKYAGQTGKFDVEVIKVEVSELPAVDAEFAKAFGVESGDMEEFRADLKKNMELELKRALAGSVKQNVMDALLENNEFQLPEALVDGEIDQLIESLKQQNAQQGQTAMPDVPRDLVEEQAKKRVKLGLIMAEIVQQNKMTADGQRVREKIEEFAQTYHAPEEVVNWYYSNPKELQKVESAVLEDQLVDYVLEAATVTEVPSNFKDVMNPPAKKASEA